MFSVRCKLSNVKIPDMYPTFKTFYHEKYVRMQTPTVRII